MTTRTFEIRHFTADPAANGESDFLGPTAVLDTAGRLDFLRAFATTARRFFGQPAWDRMAVTEDEVAAALARVKPQPLPTVRPIQPIVRWRWLGHRPGVEATDAARLAVWQAHQDLIAQGDGVLAFRRPTEVDFAFPRQSWRCLACLRLRRLAAATVPLVCTVGEAWSFTCAPDGRINIGGELPADDWCDLRLELGLDHGVANLLLGTRRLAQVALPPGMTCERIRISVGPGWELGGVWVQSWSDTSAEHGQRPLSMVTVLDETFRQRPSVTDWSSLAYDDRVWTEAEAPFAHGGERHAGEDLYLRHRFRVSGKGRVLVRGETLFPGGEVWMNGRVVAVMDTPRPFLLDVSAHVQRDGDNILGIRVFPFRVARHIAHGSTDFNSGWFAGRCRIEEVGRDTIEDLFVTTASLGPVPELRLRVRCQTQAWGPYDCKGGPDPQRVHRLRVQVLPWFPDEGPVLAETVAEVPLAYFQRPIDLDLRLAVPDARPWTPEAPVLYRVEATLLTTDGAPLDDAVLTTGLRTVNQQDGTFRLNGRPEILRGGLLFGMRPPLEDQVRTLRCASLAQLVRDVLLAKQCGANCIRMSVHEGTYLGCNDPRLAELGDQLGMCFLWSTSAWVRTASAWQVDQDVLRADVRLVRNHPSIVVWQPGNHPKFFTTDDGLAWWRETFQTILAQDDSRLICPFGGSGMMNPPSDDGRTRPDGSTCEPEPTWVHPLAARGDFDCPTGYAKPQGSWPFLRAWPEPPDWDCDFGWTRGTFKRGYLASHTHAFFDFESEETIGQPNWELLRGTAAYRLWSYEHGYDQNTVGRLLDFDEWELSQAWQGLSAAEAYRKKRLLDYDGLFWCCLDGGGNMGTYQKPVTDHLGHAKIAYHVLRMVFHPTIAGSGNVDISYGPGDVIPVRVIHLGEACKVDVTVRLRTPEGKLLAEKTWSDIALPARRCVVNVADWPPPRDIAGMVAVEYEVTLERNEITQTRSKKTP